MKEELPKGFIKGFLDYFMLEQDRYREMVLKDVLPEKRKAARGRSAKLMIDGPGGGIFYLRLSLGERVEWLPEDKRDNIRNTLYMPDTTFFYLLIGVMDPREAYANGEFRFSGDTAPYDVEEILRLFDHVVKIFSKVYEGAKGRLNSAHA